MSETRITKHHAGPPAGTRRREFEERILAAIEKEERAGRLPPLSANSKSLLFLRLKERREAVGFIAGAHRRWPDLPEKRQKAAQTRIVRSYPLTGPPSDHDRFYPSREIPDAALFVMTEQNAVETIDSVGRDGTVQLLIGSPSISGAFQEIAQAFFTPWSNAPDPRSEVFSKWIERVRCLLIVAGRAEWLGRRLAVTSPEAAEAEFGGLPPLWFDRLPLQDTDGLKGEAAAWIKRARERELERRTEAAAEAVFAWPAAVPPAIAPVVSVAVEPPKDAPKAELQTLTEETVPVPAKVRESFPNRAKKIKALVESLKPKIKANANALYTASTVGEPDRRTWTKLLRGEYVQGESIHHAIAFFKRKGLKKLERADIPDD